MKTHLRTIGWVGLGFVGFATVAGLTLQSSDAVVSHHNRPVVSTEAIAPTPQPVTVAQARTDNALAAELQGEPVVVKIYADWCAACQRLRPITSELQQQFNGRANFVVFDVTNRNTTRAAEARARELGLSNFLAAHRAQTSTIAVINPSNGEILRQFRYNFNQQDYVNAINQSIARVSARS